MAEKTGRDRRKLINYFISPALQLMLFTPYLIILFGFVITNLLVVRYAAQSIGDMSVNPGAVPSFNASDAFSRLIYVSAGGMVTAALLGLVAVLVISHRLLGPIYNIERHVRRLKDGEYDHRIVLRKGDQLTALATDLNKITERLAQASADPRSS